MKVIHTVSGFTIAGGGVTTCTYELLWSLNAAGVDARLFTMQPTDGTPLFGNSEEWIHAVDNDCRTPYGYSANLKRALSDESADIYHINGLWLYSNHLPAALARKRHRPYVISPHGMLHRDALRRSAWKKWPLRHLFFNRDIRKASAVHVTSDMEAESVRDFGYTGRVEIIPNPVVVPDFLQEGSYEPAKGNNANPFTIGFLGRIHPVKGIEHVLRAMALVGDKAMRLVVMGSGEPAYEASLRQLASQLGLADRVEWAGRVEGRRKYEMLASADTLMVTSDFENFGMIVPEALLVETPVIATTTTPWRSLEENRCGWWVERTDAAIAGAIEQAAALTPEQRLAMGRRGRRFALEAFSPSTVAGKMASLYRDLL